MEGYFSGLLTFGVLNSPDANITNPGARAPLAERTIRIDVAYDGTPFVGWQRQDNGPSVQAELESALGAALGVARIVINGASRTDAGVHARNQVASARVATRLDDITILRAMNARLPESIAVLSVKTVEDTFHARFSTTGKRYIYKMECSRRRSPFHRTHCAWMPLPLDVRAMREGARALVGTQDFASFANVGSPRSTTIRTIRSVHVFTRGDVTFFAFEGDGFLYNQVRSMVGTLCLVGRGRLAAQDVEKILRARDRRAAGPTAPPEGLFLLRVLYEKGTSWAPHLSEEDIEED